MPSDWLPVPHHRQSSVGACLPACARMVLNYLGLDVEETRLARLLRSRPFGTPAYHIRLLETLGVSVTFGPMSLPGLRAHLQDGVPCIVFLQTGELPEWEFSAYHAVVVVGLTEDTVYLHDPALEDAPRAAPLDDFMLAWSEFDYECAVVTRPHLETLAAKQWAAERARHFAAFESTLETAPPPEADPAELTDEPIQAEVDAVREAC